LRVHPPPGRASPPTHQWKAETEMKYGLLWLLGVPIPVLILIYFLFS
jgi:hypothetical protein